MRSCLSYTEAAAEAAAAAADLLLACTPLSGRPHSEHHTNTRIQNLITTGVRVGRVIATEKRNFATTLANLRVSFVLAERLVTP